jgi:hypothetical protein
MTAAVSLNGVHILATDTRHGGTYSDGRVVRSDHGKKIARSRFGLWVSGSGDAVLLDAVQRALHALEQPTPDRIAATIRDASAAAIPGIVEAFCDATPERTVFHVARDGWIASYAPDGSLTGAGVGRDRFCITYPPEKPAADTAARNAAFGRDLNAARDPFAVVRRIAREFEEIASTADSVSLVVEMAVGDHFIRASAHDLARSTGHIGAMFTAAPIGPTDFLSHWMATPCS